MRKLKKLSLNRKLKIVINEMTPEKTENWKILIVVNIDIIKGKTKKQLVTILLILICNVWWVVFMFNNSSLIIQIEGKHL